MFQVCQRRADACVRTTTFCHGTTCTGTTRHESRVFASRRSNGPPRLGRPVVDKSGLKGLYDFELTIDLQTILRLYAELGINVPGLPANLPEGSSIMTTLQGDLGLKVDSQREPGEVLVIDYAELPTPD